MEAYQMPRAMVLLCVDSPASLVRGCDRLVVCGSLCLTVTLLQAAMGYLGILVDNRE